MRNVIKPSQRSNNILKKPLVLASPEAEKILFVYLAVSDVSVSVSLLVATKKLRPYFQAHPVVVLTDFPLRSTIHKPDLFGRMARWAIELGEFGIEYKPRLAKKGQVLTDFLAKIPQSGKSLDNLNW